MQDIPRELIIGAIGSVIGALIVYLSQSGLQITKKARERARKAREEERSAWRSKNIGIRQGITNQYLFSVLRYLFLGNLLWFIGEVGRAPMTFLYVRFEVFLCIIIIFRAGALLCFFLGLGHILRYLGLHSLEKTFEIRSLDTLTK
jgi:hypothetical protein